MRLLKHIFFSWLIIFSFVPAFSQQPVFSIATNLSIQRSLKKDQRFWAVGQTVYVHFHLSPTEGIYGWISYYTNGKFNNNVTATAKSVLTLPQQKNYRNSSAMGFKHVSVGWKKYLKGSSFAEEGWSLYGTAGFGLLFGRVDNSHSIVIDTSLYQLPVRAGQANFKRLTFDLGLGWEIPIGGDFYLYAEGQAWIPTTDYPSKYLFINNNAPLVGLVNAGIRILF